MYYMVARNKNYLKGTISDGSHKNSSHNKMSVMQLNGEKSMLLLLLLLLPTTLEEANLALVSSTLGFLT